MLANSDSEADQNVKKQVRDAVGAYIEPYLLECENIEETRATVNDHMDEIIAVSKETLAANGFTYGASAELTHTDFPEKTYGDYTFPEGNYEALEITLGDGAGHNWWCVLYPNMCFRGSVCTRWWRTKQRKILRRYSLRTSMRAYLTVENMK